ncbi:MAG TPA: cytochrome c [Chryseosolibacter sp.]|nr:cytochrome c [Chryseosolibacter sp.]
MRAMTICAALVVLFSVAPSALPAQDNHNVDESAARGKIVFGQNCLACHQADGSGVPNLAPPLVKGAFVSGDKARVIGIVMKGMQGVEINGEYYANPMPSFSFLSDQEIADVLTFVRSNFSNSATAVTGEDVAEARKNLKP